MKAAAATFSIVGWISLCVSAADSEADSAADSAADSVSVSVSAAAQTTLNYPFHFEFEGNPVVKHASAADPHAVVYDDTLWVYTSSDGNQLDHGGQIGDDWTYEHMDGYRAFSTKDKIHWTDHGEIFNSSHVPWSDLPGWMWAPCAERKNGMYYLYYPHMDVSGNFWRVGVATADQPQGPFTDTGAPIEGAIGIDPMVFIDDDGEAYLYLNNRKMGKLQENMIELAEPMRNLTYASPEIMEDKNVRFQEGSFMHKKGGVYYYSYSNGHKKDKKAYYAMGDNPYGPFEWKGALVGETSGAPDHHSIVHFNNEWTYFSHYGTPSPEKDMIDWWGFRRTMTMEPLQYNADGTIQIVKHQHGSRTSFRVNAGGPWQSQGNFVADERYHGGSTYRTYASIGKTDTELLFQTARVGDRVAYDVPLDNGLYRVSLMFAETEWNAPLQRRFNVSIERNTVTNSLDIWSKVGQNTAYIETHETRLEDGQLNIVFDAVDGEATVSAIDVSRMDPDQPLPEQMSLRSPRSKDTKATSTNAESFPFHQNRTAALCLVATFLLIVVRFRRYAKSKEYSPVPLDETVRTRA